MNAGTDKNLDEAFEQEYEISEKEIYYGETEDKELLQEIDDEILADKLNKRKAGTRLTGLILLLGGLVGWIASLELFIGKLFLLENPGSSLSCDINPFISCGSVMMTWQASAFGIPNMAIGLAGFAIMGVVGSLMISNVKLPQWFNWATLGGMTFAFGFVHFLSYSAIFVIRALCPWCMVVWAVVAPMFFVKLANVIEDKQWHKQYKVLTVFRHWIVLTVVWYFLVALVIFWKFFQQWMVMLGIS